MHNAKELLAKIKKEGIKPTPKWQFILKNLLFWALFGVSILLGTAALSIIIHSFGDSGMGLASHFYHMRFVTVFEFFPIYWAIFFVLFILSSYFGIKHTKKGYKYSHIIVVLGVFLGSSFFGYIVYSTGQAERMERAFANRMPVYKSMEDRNNKMWERVEDGFLRGEIQSLNKNNILNLKGFDNKNWNINYAEAEINGEIKVGTSIRVLGEKLDDKNFKAFEIRTGDRGLRMMHLSR